MRRLVLSAAAFGVLLGYLVAISVWIKAHPEYVTTHPYDREPY